MAAHGLVEPRGRVQIPYVAPNDAEGADSSSVVRPSILEVTLSGPTRGCKALTQRGVAHVK